MMLPFGQEEKNGLVYFDMGNYPFDSHDKFLPYDVGYQVLLCRMDMVCLPQDANPVQEGKQDMGDGFINPLGHDMIVDESFKFVHIQVYHVVNQLVDHSFLESLALGEVDDFLFDLLLIHLVDMGDLIPVFMQKGNIEQVLELLVIIIADVCLRTAWFEKAIPLFPDADRMGFDTGKIFKILYGKGIHKGYTIGARILFNQMTK